MGFSCVPVILEAFRGVRDDIRDRVDVLIRDELDKEVV